MKRALRRLLDLDQPVALPPVERDEQAERAAAGRLFDMADLTRRARWQNEAVVRSLCRSSYLGDGVAVARVLGRYRMMIDTSDRTVGIHLLTDGYWEMWLTEEIARRVKPGMVVADVGANLGYFSLLMADLVGDEGRVHCFEPNRAMAALLRDTLAINGFAARAPVHEIALGGAAGTARLLVPPGEPGAATLAQYERNPRAADERDVKVARFDAIAALGEADFVKIDVEGAEIDVWRGMEGVLARGRPLTVAMEFCPTRYADPAAFLSELTAGGFALAVIDPVEGVTARTAADVLANRRSHDQMLLLSRGDA